MIANSVIQKILAHLGDGERYRPPETLHNMAQEGGKFYTR